MIKAYHIVAGIVLTVGALFISQVIHDSSWRAYKEFFNDPSKIVSANKLIGGGSEGTSLPSLGKLGYRLPGDIIPLHYELSLRIDLDEFSFIGSVKIKIECKTPTNTIILHSDGLNIGKGDVTLASMSGTSSVAVKVVNVSEDKDNEFLLVSVGKRLAKGTYELYIPFTGTIADGLSGLYRSSYVEKATNTTKWLAATQFESTDARRAFPCFDEPAMKARFSIRLGHKPGLSSISNMPQKSQNSANGWEWDEYEETKPMSTYLIAFMVSDLAHQDSPPEPNKPLIRVFTRNEVLTQVGFSQEVTPKFLNYFEDFFGLPYPLPKIDLVALPDFGFGGMENWGLITFREDFLLLDPKTTSQVMQYEIANVLAHELSHMWFGDLVTMKWWTDLWLNEGFATYMSSLAVHNQFPDWNSYNFEVSDNFLSVFSLDSLESSHPISVPIGHPDEIHQIFDTISYSKGSFLLHMINRFLGEDVLRRGVSSYLEKLKYGNAEQDDLWAALTDAAAGSQVLPPGVSVKQVMDSWTLKKGFPVIMVTRDGGKITLSQKRFLAIKPKSGTETKDCWWVPVSYAIQSRPAFNETRASHWLSCNDEQITVDTGAAAGEWVILNNKGSGLYRVNYDSRTWELIINTLYGQEATRIDEMNRMLLVSDAMALAYVGELPYSTAFQVLKYIQKERAYLPWRAAAEAIGNIEQLLWLTEKYFWLKRVMQSLITPLVPLYSSLRAMPPKMEQARLKLLVLRWACECDMPICNVNVRPLFKEWMAGGKYMENPIPKDLRPLVYCKGVRLGIQADWNVVWQRYLQTDNPAEKGNLQYALSCTTDNLLLNELLEKSLDEKSGIRKQDATDVFIAVARSSRVGFQAAKEFLEKNIQRIHDYFAPDTQELIYYIKTIATRLVDADKIEKMKKFFNEHKQLLNKAQLAVQQSEERMEANLAWMEAYYKKIDMVLIS